MTALIPGMLSVRQRFPESKPVNIRAAVQSGFETEAILTRIKPGMRIAVAVGSRGITNLRAVVESILDVLKAAGAQPFIIPAMGSHGGATPEGQADLLREYGVSEDQLKVPIRASMEVERIGATPDGVDVYLSVEALKADGIVVVNRVKPHTDFSGTIGSGILKMIVIGLGKRVGAATFHAAASHRGYEHTIRSISSVSLQAAPILCGVAIVENQFHDTARIAVFKSEEIARREEEVFVESKNLMPRLPFDEIDFLIIDRIGKNISGAGMDPNITGRGVHGYSSFLGNKDQSKPRIRRIFVRDLTPETHGNGIGIGFADFTTSRLVRGMDHNVTAINALTSLTPQGAKIPIHFETDREAITQALISLALPDVRQAKVVRIADTLSLGNMEVSEAYSEMINEKENLMATSVIGEMKFDISGNLMPLSE
ncbi:MAG: DUF2088 domain-containing protein [Pedosphaera sp.]|nr:DUF2088 domain-containing protein [Pedosphaera sp.]